MLTHDLYRGRILPECRAILVAGTHPTCVSSPRRTCSAADAVQTSGPLNKTGTAPKNATCVVPT